MDWELRQGDCLDPVTGLASLPDKSVAHVICDPPYEAEAHTKGRRAGASGGGAEARPLDFDPITEAQRAAAGAHFARLANRWILVFCQVEASAKWAEAMVAGGAKYVRTAIWVKPGAAPQFTGDRPGMGYESIVVCHAPGRTAWNGGGRHGVFECPSSDRDRVHMTQKPLALMEQLVRLFTDPGEIVLDPFAGSGTTGVACRRLGRRFLGWEVNASYADIARRRIETAREQLMLGGVA